MKRTGQQEHRRTVVLAALAAAFGAAMSVPSLTAPSAYAAAPPRPLDAKRIFAQSEPATVMVLGDFKATVAVPTVNVNESALQDELASEVNDGSLTTDTAALVTRSLQLIASSPDTYLQASEPARTSNAEFQATGSGFVIDQSGYIVTNAHVAAPHDDEVKTQLAQIGLQQIVDQDIKDMQSSLSASGFNVSQDVLTALGQADAKWLAAHMTVQSLSKSFSAVLGANIPGVTTTINLITADVVSAGDPIPGRDVAILKVEQNNLPTLPMGDDSALRPGDKLYVLGYPGAATFHPLISNQSITEPSFTTGTLSARKQATGGFEVLQTDAAITHGNSGGPVIDQYGNVVGIATFGSLDQNQQEVQGFNFIMPSTLIKEFIARSGAHPGESLFTKLYKKGLDQEAAGQYKAALATFTTINQLSPGHPYVAQHLSTDQSQVAQGHGGSSGKSNSAVFIAVAAVAVVLLLGGGGLVLFKRRKKHQNPQAVTGIGGQQQPPVSLLPPVARAPEEGEPQPATAPAGTAALSRSEAFCPDCGTPHDAGSRFCPSCGHRFRAA